MSWIKVSMLNKTIPGEFLIHIDNCCEWCRENVSTPGMLWYYDESELYFSFSKEEDVIAFKLKFGA